MKKVSMRLMGVVLTLALLAGLIMGAIPVSAGNMAWTSLDSPVLTENTDATLFAISADGEVIYLFDGTKFNKSTDGGYTWDDELELPNGVTELTAIAINPEDSDYIIATDGTDVYRSSNGADSWKTITPTGFTAINGIDITVGDEIVIAVAADEGIAIYDDDEGDWYINDDGADPDYLWGDAPAYAVAFSPNFEDDPAVVVVTDNGTRLVLRTVIVDFPEKLQWDFDVDPVDAGAPAAGSDVTIAFPADYDSASEPTVFVGVVGDDVYRVSADDEDWQELSAGTINSISYKGDASDGILAVGYANGTVKTSANADTSDDPDFDKSDKNPVATNAVVKFSPTEDILYVGTVEALYVADADTDYKSFDAISFISVADFDNVTFVSTLKGAGTDNQFRIIKETGDPDTYMIFASTDAGKTWKMIYLTDTYIVKNIYPTKTYAEDQTIYIYQGVDYNKYVMTTDGGATWSKQLNLPGRTYAECFTLVDADTFFIGSDEGVQRNDWADPVEIADGEIVKNIWAFPDFIAVKTAEGSIAVSTDDGATFEVLGEEGYFEAPFEVTFDVANETIYAVNTPDGNIMSWVLDSSDDWETEVNFADLPADLQDTGISSISLASDGLWYITSVGNDNGQIWRATDLEGEDFEVIPGSVFDGNIPLGPQALYKDANGDTVLLAAISGPAKDDNYPVYMKTFTQTVVNAPETVNPAADSSTGTDIEFKWNKVNYTGTLKYDLEIAYDADFNNLAVDKMEAITGTMKTVKDLDAGKQYFWRVRVSQGNPLASKWSTAVPFSTKVQSANLDDGITAGNRLSPVSGATGVSTMPAITWGAVSGATGYNFQIATDAGFTSMVDSKDGLTSTVYSPAAALEPNKVYFWRVQAVSGTNVGDWVTSAFTTAGGSSVSPDPTQVSDPDITVPAPTIIVNPAPATTPAYIWVIIVIGAILVIAIIVLIARTRRV